MFENSFQCNNEVEWNPRSKWLRTIRERRDIVRFPSLESEQCGIDLRSKAIGLAALLFSLRCHFSNREMSIENVNVEILDHRFTGYQLYFRVTLPFIRFNQFRLFFLLFSPRNDILRAVSIVAFYEAVIDGMPLISEFQFPSCFSPFLCARELEILIQRLFYFNRRIMRTVQLIIPHIFLTTNWIVIAFNELLNFILKVSAF